MKMKNLYLRTALRILLLLTLTASTLPAEAAKGDVLLVPLTGTVGVQMEEFVQRTLAEPECSLVILQLDTPGGLVEAMRGIVQAILASSVPVVVWVPSGGRAASAGAFIVQAAHVAAMAPGTNIGAAHPVTAGGEDIAKEKESDMSRKVLNDLKAQMRSVVQLRGRNEAIAEGMVEESLSLTAQEALEEGVIDVIADSVPSLLAAVSGRGVQMESRTVRIELPEGARVLRAGMSWREQIIQFVSSPEIAYLLLSGGLMAIFFEVITPGGFILGTVGGLMLLLGSIGLKMLPFSWAGVALMGAGILVMALDLYMGGGGLLTLAGLPVFCIGGLFLFQAPGGELLRFSLSVVVGVALALAACFLLFAFLVVRGLRRKVTTGQQGMIGLEAEVLSDVGAEPGGQVRCRGELWRARAAEGEFPAGSVGTVAAVEGITLVLRHG